MVDLTLAIATCGRPRVLRRLLNSIKTFVDVPHKIIVLDNTKAFTDKVDTDWIKNRVDKYIEVTDRKIGCCESNNILVDACDTKYIMHLDDDIYFIQDFTIKRMFEVMDLTQCDIVSCMWQDTYYKNYREASIKHFRGCIKGQQAFWKIGFPHEPFTQMGFEFVESDESLHSMIINMDVYKKVKWDNNYEWKGDREDFFLQCKDAGIKIITCLDTYVVHDPQPFKYGSLSYEFDGTKAIEYFISKWGMRPMFHWDGPQFKPGNPNIAMS